MATFLWGEEKANLKFLLYVKFLPVLLCEGGGGGERKPGRKGDRRNTGDGKRGGGSWRNRGKLHNIVQYFAVKKCKKAVAIKNWEETRIKGYGKREL